MSESAKHWAVCFVRMMESGSVGEGDGVAYRRTDYDLCDRSEIERLFRDFPPEIVIHLAAVVGGIGANQASPDSLFYDNAIMGSRQCNWGVPIR